MFCLVPQASDYKIAKLNIQMANDLIEKVPYVHDAKRKEKKPRLTRTS